jgi:hypothetical protein
VTNPALTRPVAVAPVPERNQVEAVGQRSKIAIARTVVEFHRSGLASRRERDLLSEKFLLHIDGSGDFQWADIYDGQRVAIPRLVSDYRKTQNLLRPVVDNAVAHHTTAPLKYQAESGPDRRAKATALVDTLWMNHVVQEQDLNGLFADALYLAMPAGFCPVHRYWRPDPVLAYEPTGSSGEASVGTPGTLDCWVGNPFDTVFDIGAKRGSAHSCSYGRVLPVSAVRKAFAHVPEAQTLQGSTRIPSAASYQRLARSWKSLDLGIHGSGVLGDRQNTEGEELILLVCLETLPGVMSEWPDGRLQIVAVPGATDLRRGEGAGGHAILLADQDLPARDFSWTLFYSHHRGEDILGKPWVEDIDQLQVDLNIARSKRWEAIIKMMEAPIVAPGGALTEDMAELGGYNILEIEPSLAAWRPRQMEFAQGVIDALSREVEDLRNAIFSVGGYQAASRGELPGSRTPYRAILALQQADNTIHGPVNVRYRRAAEDFARGCWTQMKAYGDAPTLVRITGDEYAYLVDPWVDNTKLSPTPPAYKVVSAFGPNPELQAQEILELLGTRGADGEPLLRTEEARRKYPNTALFSDDANPKAVARRRAKTVAAVFPHLAAEYREKSGMQETSIAHPWVQQAALQVAAVVEAQFPRLRDDDLMAHLAALSEITQDETADPIARLAAQTRQTSYYEWQAMQAGQQVPQQGAAPGAAAPAPPNTMDPRAVAAQMQGRGAPPAAMLTGTNRAQPPAPARG